MKKLCPLVFLAAACGSPFNVPWGSGDSFPQSGEDGPVMLSASTVPGALLLEHATVDDALSYNAYISELPDARNTGVIVPNFTNPIPTHIQAAHVVVTAVTDAGESLPSPEAVIAPLGVGWESALPSSPPAWTVAAVESGSQFGKSIAFVEDVDCDGYGDLAVGAPQEGDSEEGATHVFAGGSDGPSATPILSIRGTGVDAEFGGSVASAGDTNADGCDDLVIGSAGLGTDEAGAAFFYEGSPQGPALKLNLQSSSIDEQLGFAVTGAGDVDGDGLADFAVTAPTFGEEEAERQGRFELHYGNGAQPHSYIGDDADRVGSSIAAAGDVDADGFDDLLVGVGGGDLVLVFSGQATGLEAQPSHVFDAIDCGAGIYRSIASAGDVDGDDVDEIVLGATAAGIVCVLRADGTLVWSHQVPGVGRVVAEDLNGDGYSDVLVNAGGSVLVFRGSAAGLETSPGVELTDASTGAALSVGDVNGDQRTDVMVSAPSRNTVEIFAGVSQAGPRVTALPTVAHAGETVTLSSGYADSPTECHIDWGDGSSVQTITDCTAAAIAALSHRYAAAGSYRIVIEVVDAGGTSGVAALRQEILP